MGGIFDIPDKEARAAALEEQTLADGFWQDQEKAQAILKERASLLDTVTGWKKQTQAVSDALIFLELAEAGDAEAVEEVARAVPELEATVSRAELQRMLGGEHDAQSAIVSLHPGAGGLEAQDWADMLLRLYLRWAERRSYSVEMAEHLPGEGGGVKSATCTVEGAFAV